MQNKDAQQGHNLHYLTLRKKSWPSAFELGDEGHVLDDFLPSVGKCFFHFNFYLLLVFLLHLQKKRFPFLFKTLFQCTRRIGRTVINFCFAWLFHLVGASLVWVTFSLHRICAKFWATNAPQFGSVVAHFIF